LGEASSPRCAHRSSGRIDGLSFSNLEARRRLTDHARWILDRQSIANEYGKADTPCQTSVGNFTSSTSTTSMARDPRPRVLRCALWCTSTPRTHIPQKLWDEHVCIWAVFIAAQGLDRLNGIQRAPTGGMSIQNLAWFNWWDRPQICMGRSSIMF
jgi:hypothetical protein